MPKKTLSKEVQDEMERLIFLREAEFCRLIRRWYQAEDDRGIPPLERCHRRLELRSFLLRDVSFATFPVHGAFIKGFPQVMFEGLLQSIDALLLLYGTTQASTYNQRTLSTLENETFFSFLSDMETTGQGCP